MGALLEVDDIDDLACLGALMGNNSPILASDDPQKEGFQRGIPPDRDLVAGIAGTDGMLAWRVPDLVGLKRFDDALEARVDGAHPRKLIDYRGRKPVVMAVEGLAHRAACVGLIELVENRPAIEFAALKIGKLF